jgi:flavin reductase (DIM6/NTAB) family NADH-FMN oxidoreductase RutF
VSSAVPAETFEDPLGPEPAAEVAAPTVDAALYRSVLGHFATGVTVITAIDPGTGEPVGLAANSFTSVSLDPPLVAFCAAYSSSTWPRIQAARAFCVNILGEGQEALCRLMATKGADKFAEVPWEASVNGSPVLAGGLAWIDCTIEAEHDAGDHVIVVGRVHELGFEEEGSPLLFFRGGYGRFDL